MDGTPVGSAQEEEEEDEVGGAGAAKCWKGEGGGRGLCLLGGRAGASQVHPRERELACHVIRGWPVCRFRPHPRLASFIHRPFCQAITNEYHWWTPPTPTPTFYLSFFSPRVES